MRIIEVFDTKFPVKWERSGRFELGGFQINDLKYIIQIENKPFYINGLERKKTAEVSFYLDSPDVEQSYSTTGTSHNISSTIYGVVFNNILTKFSNYDALSLIANRRHSNNDNEFKQKKSIYSSIGKRLSKLTGSRCYERDLINGDYELIVSKVELNEPGFVLETQIIKDFCKQLTFSKFERFKHE